MSDREAVLATCDVIEASRYGDAAIHAQIPVVDAEAEEIIVVLVQLYVKECEFHGCDPLHWCLAMREQLRR